MNNDNEKTNENQVETSPMNIYGYDEIERSTRSNPSPESEKVLDEKQKHQFKKKRKKVTFWQIIDGLFSDLTFSKIMNVFFFCFVFHAAEQLFIIPNVNTRGLVSKIIGFAVVLCYCFISQIKPKRIGFVLHGNLMRKAFVTASFLNVMTLLIIGCEALILRSLGGAPIIRIYAYSSSFSAGGSSAFLLNMCLLLLTSFFSALMLEFLFRGLILKTGRSKFGFWSAARLQTVLYVVWFLVLPMTKIFRGEITPKRFLIFIAFYLVYEGMAAVKWAMCVRISGTIWLSFFDHFFFNFLIDSVHVINNNVASSAGIDSYKMLRIIAIQLVSLLIIAAYYKRTMKEREEFTEKMEKDYEIVEREDIDVIHLMLEQRENEKNQTK